MPEEVSKWPEWTQLAFQYGPFFFVLLVFWMSRWARKIYHEEPASQVNEKNTYRWVFIGTTSFGMILIIVSVVWWWNYRSSTHVFRGSIKNLKEYESVQSGNLYFKSVWSGKRGSNLPQYHDEEFVVIQNEPFSQDQKFDINFSKGPDYPELKPFKIAYDPKYSNSNITPAFEIVTDTTKNEPVLKITSTITGDNGFHFSFSDRAFAMENGSRDPGYISNATVVPMQEQAAGNMDEMIRTLQEERSGVGSKIFVLEKMGTLDRNSLIKLVKTKTDKEEMILTVIDLSRHTDKELAFKALKLMRSIDANKIISDRLNSSNKSEVKSAQQIIRRLDKIQANAIIKSLNSKKLKELKKFVEEIKSGKTLTPLKPTGSAAGDRYYVRARWNPGNKNAVECLTKLFNKALLDRPSLQKEDDFMRGRNERWVYWYSKEWALDIARNINSCGGSATFESPDSQDKK